ncbi:hypothetical protein Misp06_04321 [Microbulbifer sp. NBRC 101763]|uniref:hypothetical protein n=1 Tax=Microbulbifer sp. NBRC 101763 TaxID=1113820 RepID=UPI0030A4553B
MGRTKKFLIPESENEFLSDILGAIRKRSKSLKYNCWNISVEKVFEHFKEGRLEKVEIRIQPSDTNAELKVDVWEDRLIHLICWERTKPQKWDWEYDGKFLPIYEGKDFVLALEETRAKFFQMSESKVKEFENSWAHLLANGLKSVQ